MGVRARPADAVLQGGGVKVLGLVGALTVAERHGYTWCNVAGTSAGAIVAALTAAGYTAREIADLMLPIDFRIFCDPPSWARIPVVGPALAVLLTKGLFRGDVLEDWLRAALAERGVTTFADVVIPEEPDERFRFRLQVIAADISRGRILVLPQDMAYYGIQPEDVDVARAVRMSASLPYYFRPVVQSYVGGQRDALSYIVDGGLLSNFPVWLFDVEGTPPWPTFGFMLSDPHYGQPNVIRGPISYAGALVTTMLEAHDALSLEASDSVRTIRVPTEGVGTADFGLPLEGRKRLYRSGVAAASRFFDEWDFGHYVQTYRASPA